MDSSILAIVEILTSEFGKCCQLMAVSFWRLDLPAHEVPVVSTRALLLDGQSTAVLGIWWLLSVYLMNE